MRKAIVSVINDLVTDQRVHRTCLSLIESGFNVMLIGRIKNNSLPMNQRTYYTHRMKLIFERGPLFYAEYNIRLFFFLLFNRTNLLVSNDLDTLLPNYIIHVIKGIPIVYDSHEYFTETPELINRPVVQKVWKTIEKTILPRLKDTITVSDSIANLFSKEYGIDVKVVRNIPIKRNMEGIHSKAALGLPFNKKILLMQGSGLNIDRGLKELVEAMQYVDESILLIIGDGDVLPILKQKTTFLKIEEKIIFIPKQAFNMLYNYTIHADLGISIDKDTNINYRFSLPNKLFDYIHANIPILASALPEIKNIIDKYNIGETIDNHNPEHIAETINTLLLNTDLLTIYKKNTKKAAQELNWNMEKKVLERIFKAYA
ncbi:MAG: glycosyltransferase family 4 protein [Bacteroidetes bacterium]|nr:glycosyltransferase family 4 protein [Bacteroidota bacterium]